MRTRTNEEVPVATVPSWIALGVVATILGTAAPRAVSNDVTSSPERLTTSIPSALTLDAIRDIADLSPSVAVAVLSLLDPATSSFSRANNFLYLSGAPTQRTAELLLSGADTSAVARSLSRVPLNLYSVGDPYVQIHWEESVQANGDVLLRVSSAVVAQGGCGMQIYESLEPDTLISLHRTEAGPVAWRKLVPQARVQ